MSHVDPDSLRALADSCTTFDAAMSQPLPRALSIWEITSWILPMAPEHLRRVLAAEPALPQGMAGAEGGTRWFSTADLGALRQHFATGPRKARYLAPVLGTKAPVVALTGPQGGQGRSTSLLHLATAAALSGYRILVIDGDPAGRLAHSLQVAPSGQGTAVVGATVLGQDNGVLALIAKAAALHLRRLNAARLDRGEPPVAMDATLGATLDLAAGDLIRPSVWPGLDVLMAGPGLMQADLQIGSWRQAQRGWRPWRALAEALESEGLRQRYDLILCDTPRGLGPLALSILASADVLLAPLALRGNGLALMAAGLRGLARAMTTLQDEDQMLARALGQPAMAFGWQRLMVLPTRAGPDAPQRMAKYAAKLPHALLPVPLPEVQDVANGTAAQFYDLDYRDVGRLAYAPLRQASDAAWRCVADGLTGLWPQDVPAQATLPL